MLAHARYISTYQDWTRVQAVTINLLEKDRCPNHLPPLSAINTWCYSTWYIHSLSRTLTLTYTSVLVITNDTDSHAGGWLQEEPPPHPSCNETHGIDFAGSGHRTSGFTHIVVVV